ncbi:MAG: uracil phosphoribosyltransferase [Pseudomonadota bacterium]
MTLKTAEFPTLNIISHPLVAHKLTLLRAKETPQQAFKALLTEISVFITYEATRHLPLEPVEIETPVMRTLGSQLSEKQPMILPILRAGLGMVDGVATLLPSAKVGHIGLYRDEETRKPKQYYFKVPSDAAERRCFICDPMLATGGSAIQAVHMLKERGLKNIIFLCVLAAPEGVANFTAAHPDVPIFTASLDERLNEHAYIIPGLGDAGDRLFGTL